MKTVRAKRKFVSLDRANRFVDTLPPYSFLTLFEPFGLEDKYVVVYLKPQS